MTSRNSPSVDAAIEEIYRNQSRRIFATLIRLLGDFDLAEEALHEAFSQAVEQWPRDGIPANPRAWLVSAGRFKAIDSLRRRTRLDAHLSVIADRLDRDRQARPAAGEETVEDDQLRLIFTCCHPALAFQTQVALTLREVCGLTTEEIASAFLTAPATIAQRIVRGKAKIRDAGIPYEIPHLSQLHERLESVHAVIYLVFNEGYSASGGDSLLREDLCDEAIRLGRLLAELLPDPETFGLIALMLLQSSRRKARATDAGDLILLEDQDRSLWDRKAIEEGTRLVNQAIRSGPVGVYTLQAAIASVHANAPSSAETDWQEITAFYEILREGAPTPIVRLNQAVAIAMRDGPLAGLSLIEELLESPELADYHLAWAAKADLCRRLGRVEPAREAYQKALLHVRQEPERRFLEGRLRELSGEAQ